MARGATVSDQRWSCAVERRRRLLDQIDQNSYHVVRLSGRRLMGRGCHGAAVAAAGRGRGRSKVSGAEPEGRRMCEVGVFGAGHVFPIVSNLRRGQEALPPLLPSPRHALSGGRNGNGRSNGRYGVTHNRYGAV